MVHLQDLIEEVIETLTHDPANKGKAIGTLQVARSRFTQPVGSRVARLMYEEMDKWATFSSGHVRVEVLVELLQQEGLLITQEESDATDL